MGLTRKDVKKLWTASGNECAHPECKQRLIDFERDSVIGEMSHINARKPGGSRYDEKMDEDDRESYSNRILLCRNHHKLVDDAPDEFPPELLEQWKREHEKRSPDAPELSLELLNKLIREANPSNLLVHVEKTDVECLRVVLEWEPREEFPKKEEGGVYPIVFTLDDLKDLHGRIAATYQNRINGDPMYKQVSKWTEDDLIHASSIVARITQSAIQYHQVEGKRRMSELYDEL